MSVIKLKKHAQSKYFTIMLVPYSSKKTKSIRIPHYVFHLLGASILMTILFFLFFSSKVTYFKNMANRFKANLTQSQQVNSQLMKEKEGFEDVLEQERLSYEEQLKYYEEKSKELEEKMNELDKVKEDIYDLLSKKTDFDPLAPTFTQTSHAKTTPQVTFLSHTKEKSPTPSMLSATYTDLEARLEEDAQEFDLLMAYAEKHSPYLQATPSGWPLQGKVTSYFGNRSNPFTNAGSEGHKGLDISVPIGTKVKATAKGTVRFAGWQSGYGNVVIISHGYGLETFYAHNSKLAVNVGDTVTKGTLIAYSGNTGRSTGPHLHYEVRVNGVAKNPLTYINN